ncbi:MAG: PRC-barrel domain-containing protein [Hyphomicrobiaceae bacterium]
MKKLIPLTFALAMAQTTAVFAQSTTTPPANPGPAPKTTIDKTMPAPTTGAIRRGTDLTLTEADAKAWIDKVVYSSDNKNLGEVSAFARDGSGKVTALHADIGGFLGMGETRVRIMPNQFDLVGDRVVLKMTSEQAKALPRLPKAN